MTRQPAGQARPAGLGPGFPAGASPTHSQAALTGSWRLVRRACSSGVPVADGLDLRRGDSMVATFDHDGRFHFSFLSNGRRSFQSGAYWASGDVLSTRSERARHDGGSDVPAEGVVQRARFLRSGNALTIWGIKSDASLWNDERYCPPGEATISELRRIARRR